MNTFKKLDYLNLRNIDISEAIESGKFDPEKEYDRIKLTNLSNASNLQTNFRSPHIIFISTNINMVKDISCKDLELHKCDITSNLSVKAGSIMVEDCTTKNSTIKILEASTVRIDTLNQCTIDILKADKVEVLNFHKTDSLSLGRINSLILNPNNSQLMKIPAHESLKTLTLDKCHIYGDFHDLQLKELKLNKCSLQGELKLPKNLKRLDIDTFNAELTLINSALTNIQNTLEFLHLENIDMKYFVNVYPKLRGLSLTKCQISRLYNMDISPLKSLILNDNLLNELPKIPNSVSELNIASNQFTKLNNLPPNLIKLFVSNNDLSYVPKLPTNLEVLDCSSNSNLRGLPSLPNNIKELYSNECNIIELPNKLPHKLSILECVKNRISELPKLPQTLTTLKCDYNLITNLNYLPKNLVTLSAKGNLLSKMPTLPFSLKNVNLSRNKIKGNIIIDSKAVMSIDLSHNLIEQAEIRSDRIWELNLDFNLLKEIPTKVGYNKIFNYNFTKLYLRHNRINTLKNIEFTYNICQDYIQGNPIEQQIFKGVESPEFEYEERVYNNMKVSLATIPKGTVLFRGYYNEEPKAVILNDFIGFPIPNTTKHRVIPYMNVFFYPYPFITQRIMGDLDFEMISVVTTPIKMVLNILPSLNYRGEKDLENYYITSCNNIEWEGYKGNNFDPCFTSDFLKENPDIVGNIALAFEDTKKQKCVKEGKDIELNQYHRVFSDVLNTGIPEFILYPLRKRIMEDIVTDSTDVTQEWLAEHLNNFNYFPLYITYTPEEMKKTVDDLLSPEGLSYPDDTFGTQTLHMTIDPKTKFFVIPELTEPHVLKRLVPISETDKLSLL